MRYAYVVCYGHMAYCIRLHQFLYVTILSETVTTIFVGSYSFQLYELEKYQLLGKSPTQWCIFVPERARAQKCITASVTGSSSYRSASLHSNSCATCRSHVDSRYRTRATPATNRRRIQQTHRMALNYEYRYTISRYAAVITWAGIIGEKLIGL